MTGNWLDSTLGDIAEIVSGATPKTSVEQYWGGGIPWATPTDLSGLDEAYIDSTARTLSAAGLKSCASSLLPANSVLLSSRAPIGLVAINTVSMATNQGFKSLVPDRARVDSKFLYWWLRYHRAQLEAMGNGATFKEVSKRTVASVEISLPPVEEQRRIAGVLDAAEALRAKRRQALDKLNSLTQAIFTDIFGDPGHPKQGEVVARLGDCVELYSGSTLPKGEEFNGQVSGYALVKVSDLARDGNDKFINSTREWSSVTGPSASTCPSGSIVFPKRGGAIAKNRKRITTIPSVLDPNLMGVTPKSHSLTLPYLYTWFERLDLQSIQSGSSVPQLNKKDLAPLELKLPLVELQTKFAQLVDNVDSARFRMVQQSQQLDTLFASLQQRAFRGEL